MAKEPTYYKLTTAQNIMYVSQKFSLNKAIVDINTMLHFECEIDEKLLMQALYMALMRNESSRVRLHKVGKEVKQYLTEQAPDPIIVMDYSSRTDAELDADLNTWSKTPFPHNSMDTQLYVIRMIKKPNGFWGLFFCVSHLAFDAYTLMAIASDAMRIYVALRDGGIIPKYKATTSVCANQTGKCTKTAKLSRIMNFGRMKYFSKNRLIRSWIPKSRCATKEKEPAKPSTF